MTTVFDACVPRDEVLSGELSDDLFAARLKDVIDGVADPVYQDSRRFFENTYPTEGLKTLVREVLGRLSGNQPANSPFIRLETSFGGGKTHNLIALYHLVSGKAEGAPTDLVNPSWIPLQPWQCAGVVGSDLDPANGLVHPELTTHTLWGELAYQLGRAEAFEHVRASDGEMAAAGTQWLEKVVGDGPALIMVDELARYLRVAKVVQTANKKSDLAEQTVAFLMSLVEYAASKPKVSVVITLADSKDAFGAETEELRQELSEAKKVAARQERVITPTGETEISRIVDHRLFKHIDARAAKDASEKYLAYFKELSEKGVEIPERALRADYAAEIAQCYPFHPELLNTLNRKTATIPNFQKTRGALRLLARVVRDVWQRKAPDTQLICVHDLNLDLDDVVNDLTSRLERPQYRSVVEADISSPQKGSPAHCQVIDRIWVEAQKPPFARRTAINVFLHSVTQGVAAGVDPAELLVSLLQPGDDSGMVSRALALMLGEEKGEPGSACWFLHWDAHRYSFKTEPSLEKVIQDELAMVGRVKAKGELDERIRSIWKKGVFRPVFFPAEAADVDDDAQQPKLVIIHYDAATVSADESDTPDLVAKVFDHAGAVQSYRTYKNNLVFLVADREHTERMVQVAERFLAVRRIVGDPDRLRDFSDEQRKKLTGMHDHAELEVRVAITRAYRHLYFPSADASTKSGGLVHETLPAQDQGSVEKDQTAVVLRALSQLSKILTADDPAMPPVYLKDKAWPHGQTELTTEDLRREFAKRIGLRILLDPNQIKKTIKMGVSQGSWVYFDAGEQAGYGQVSPAPLVELSQDAMLYVPDEAKRLGIRIKGEEQPPGDATCPLCGKLPCECGEEGGGLVTSSLLTAVAEGAPAQALQLIADQFADKGGPAIGVLKISCEGNGPSAAADARALGLAIPQFGKGVYRIRQSITCEFGEGSNGDTFTSTFVGAWDRYKRLKQLTDAFAQEASKLRVDITMEAAFGGGLPTDGDQFQAIRDVLTALQLGKVKIQANELEESA